MDTPELETKLASVKELLEGRQLEALLIQRVPNFAWATCGASAYVNSASEGSVASLLLTPSGRHLITNNIEAPRLEREEALLSQGWEFHIAGWQEASGAIESLSRGWRLGADSPHPGAVDLSDAFPRLRMNLLPQEQARMRALGNLCAEAMDRAIRSVRPGMTEHEIAARLAAEALGRGVLPIVNLVGTDGRIAAFRHPLPTARVLDKYAMLVLCGRRGGLVCSVTRLIHFGRLPTDLRRRAEAVAEVDAAFIAATRPGRRLSQVFQAGLEAYARVGFPDEWRLHHQGGPAGYEPREFVASGNTDDLVRIGQAYAWNPSITGAKSEDTIMVGQEGFENLTAMGAWPTIEAEVDGQVIARPAVLEVQ
jgi:antitoxin VapB